MNSKSVKDGMAGALIALIIVFLAYSVLQGLSHDYRNSFEAVARQDLKQVSLAMHMYYEDYEEWPVNLETLNGTYRFSIHKFKLPGKYMMWELDWIYYPPKGPIDKIDRNQIMLATPTHWGKDKKPVDAECESFRIVAYCDGTVKKISEKEFQKKLNHNKKD